MHQQTEEAEEEGEPCLRDEAAVVAEKPEESTEPLKRDLKGWECSSAFSVCPKPWAPPPASHMQGTGLMTAVPKLGR